jgi:hypothetical protein
MWFVWYEQCTLICRTNTFNISVWGNTISSRCDTKLISSFVIILENWNNEKWCSIIYLFIGFVHKVHEYHQIRIGLVQHLQHTEFHRSVIGRFNVYSNEQYMDHTQTRKLCLVSCGVIILFTCTNVCCIGHSWHKLC